MKVKGINYSVYQIHQWNKTTWRIKAKLKTTLKTGPHQNPILNFRIKFPYKI